MTEPDFDYCIGVNGIARPGDKCRLSIGFPDTRNVLQKAWDWIRRRPPYNEVNYHVPIGADTDEIARGLVNAMNQQWKGRVWARAWPGGLVDLKILKP